MTTINLLGYPYCTREGLQAVRGQISVLRDLGLPSIADNVSKMADDLDSILRQIALAEMKEIRI